MCISHVTRVATPLFYFVLEIQLILKSCNLIGQEHFGPYLSDHICWKYVICARMQQIILTFIKNKIQKKVLNFPINSKNPMFGYFPNFQMSVTHGTKWATNTILSLFFVFFKKLLSQFQ